MVVNRKDNTVERDTYDAWCPENWNAPRPYKVSLSKRITVDIKYIYISKVLVPEERDGDDDGQQETPCDDELKAETPLPTQQIINTPLFVQQNSDGNVIIPNYGTLNLSAQQQWAYMLYFGGNLYILSKVDWEYYNFFVLEGEEFDKPYIKVPRDRALNECMSQETKDKFAPMTEENKAQIKTMSSLFMAENNQYGKADDNQNVIYGFVPDIKIYDNFVKVYCCGYRLDIPQRCLNELLDELYLVGNDKFNKNEQDSLVDQAL